MANIKLYKETVLPTSLESNSIYFIAPPSGGSTDLELYVTNSAGNVARHLPTKEEILVWINNHFSQELYIANDISDRDNQAASLTRSASFYVIDATTDTTVDSGGAFYLYNINNQSFIKLSEAESMDVVLDWNGLSNKPTSSVADIDDAVSKKHEHTNKVVLDKFSEVNGKVLYDGQTISSEFNWSSEEW